MKQRKSKTGFQLLIEFCSFCAPVSFFWLELKHFVLHSPSPASDFEISNTEVLMSKLKDCILNFFKTAEA